MILEPNAIYQGDCSDLLRQMDSESVDCCVTSPPYWGLRDYGTATWEGGDAECDHAVPIGRKGGNAVGTKQTTNSGSYGYREWLVCGKCGAIRIDSQIGLEPTPEAYVARMVEVFREVRRVMKKEGTLWLNLGDSYWGGKGSNGNSKARATAEERGYVQSGGTVQMETRPQDGNHAVLKPKDLIGIPWRVAFALQADGWWLRQDIIWAKPNPMPESVTDRCTKSHEYIFLMTKSAKYWYDADAIREAHCQSSLERYEYGHNVKDDPTGKVSALSKTGAFQSERMGDFVNINGRNKRDVWTVATAPCKEAHFATFPPKLIEPCIIAGCPVGGIVLDPFMGAGTVGMVARILNRQYIGLELNPKYIEIARSRIDSPENMLSLADEDEQAQYKMNLI